MAALKLPPTHPLFVAGFFLALAMHHRQANQADTTRYD